MTKVDGINTGQQLLQGAGIGGLIGAFFGRPVLGALGGLVYKLLSTDGLASAATSLFRDFADDGLGSLGSVLGGQKPQTDQAERPAETRAQQSGLPSWAKLGIGMLAAGTALNFVRDNLVSTFFGIPNYGLGFMPYGGMWNRNFLFGGGGFFPYW